MFRIKRWLFKEKPKKEEPKKEEPKKEEQKKEKPKWLWNDVDYEKYQVVTTNKSHYH